MPDCYGNPATTEEAVAMLEARRKADVRDSGALEDLIMEFQHRLALPLMLHCDTHDSTPPQSCPAAIDERVVAIQTAEAFGNRALPPTHQARLHLVASTPADCGEPDCGLRLR